MKRKICIVTGTRAEYGVLYPVMKAIERNPKLSLSVVVTGMHLLPEFGNTFNEIEADGFTIDAKVPMFSDGDTCKAMTAALGNGITKFVEPLEQLCPDVLLVIADRVEALAAALAGAFMGVPVAHIHGGDVTSGGCIDESIRHAITRFAHIHFPATKQSADTLIKMGEEPWRISIVGPLGIYATDKQDFITKNELCKKLGLDSTHPILLVIQHPVTSQEKNAYYQMKETMNALVSLGEQAVIIYPNSDAGGRRIIQAIEEFRNCPFIKIFRNLPYSTFINLMKVSSVMIGNSSSAIIEAPLFGLPAVNIGIREEGRERGGNILDVLPQKEEIMKAVTKALSDDIFRNKVKESPNPYQNEKFGAVKIADFLSEINFDDKKLMRKRLTY